MSTDFAKHPALQFVTRTRIRTAYTYGGTAGIDDRMICRNEDVTNLIFSLFCSATCSPTLAGFRSYPCPAGIEVIVLISGMMRLRR